MTAPPRHKSLQNACTHRFYLMSCEGFDELEKRAGSRCEICDIQPGDTPHGRLVIDHDYAHGYWAVRGLLCSRCNGVLTRHAHVLDAERVARYLGNPWYQHLLDAAGVTAHPAEPPDGTLLQDGKGGLWFRSGERWLPSDRRASPLAWSQLVSRRGPHLLRPFTLPPTEAIEISGYTREHVRRIVRQVAEERTKGQDEHP